MVSVEDKVRTTVDLPTTVRARIQEAVERGAAKSQNALIVQAIERYLQEAERAWIDAQFAAMSEDREYQALQLAVTEEFAPADREAWRIDEDADAAR